MTNNPARKRIVRGGQVGESNKTVGGEGQGKHAQGGNDATK
jgi:hypothetical protein